MTDCAECRALLALIITNDEDRAIMELRGIGPRARAACGKAARLLAELCEDAEARPSWERDRTASRST